MKNLLFALLAVTVLFVSCQEEELIPEETLAPPQYLTWSEGDWWVYESSLYNYYQGDTVVTSVDTTFALADTAINGQLYRTLSRRLYSGGNLYLRDSSGYVVEPAGHILYSYTNFTDTLLNLLTPSGGGWFAQMVEDPAPTITPAGVFNTINFKSTHYHFTTACGDSIYYSDRQFAEDIGLIRMTYHYSAPGPCSVHYRTLVDYHVQ